MTETNARGLSVVPGTTFGATSTPAPPHFPGMTIADISRNLLRDDWPWGPREYRRAVYHMAPRASAADRALRKVIDVINESDWTGNEATRDALVEAVYKFVRSEPDMGNLPDPASR